MTPYYDDGQCVIYHADCRDVLPTLVAAAQAKRARVIGVELDEQYCEIAAKRVQAMREKARA